MTSLLQIRLIYSPFHEIAIFGKQKSRKIKLLIVLLIPRCIVVGQFVQNDFNTEKLRFAWSFGWPSDQRIEEREKLLLLRWFMNVLHNFTNWNLSTSTLVFVWTWERKIALKIAFRCRVSKFTINKKTRGFQVSSKLVDCVCKGKSRGIK